MNRSVVLLLLLAIPFFIPVTVYAERGCCSWHGGIDYCASNGRYVCADGSFSPTCTCTTYTRQISHSVPENPVTYIKWSITPQIDQPYHTVTLNWISTESSSYSINITKTPGSDPGPLVDTYDNHFTFSNVKPGRWYVNIKSNVNGEWSKISYSEIVVPNWMSPTPTPLPPQTNIDVQPSPIPTITPHQGWLTKLVRAIFSK